MQVELLLHAPHVLRGVLQELVALEAQRNARRIRGSEVDRAAGVEATADVKHRLRGEAEVHQRRREFGDGSCHLDWGDRDELTPAVNSNQVIKPALGSRDSAAVVASRFLRICNRQIGGGLALHLRCEV